MKKVAIITGASRGIGAATAELLAERGYAVAINYQRNKDKAENLTKTINKAGGHALAIQADISKEDDVLRMFAIIDKELGPVNALVNNAGISGGIQSITDISYDCVKDVFATNVFGTFLCTREAIKRMQQQNGGSIVNVSSQAAQFGGNQLSHYAASKAAINAFTMGVAREVAKHNIRINTVSPAVVDTDAHQDISAERLSALKNSLPMERMGTAREVAYTIAWLLSAEASYLSGSIIPITGAR